MIIFDLDGTLADCEHRRHFIDPLKQRTGSDPYELSLYSPDLNMEYYYKYANGKRGFFYHKTHKRWKPDWKAFYEACDKDEPIKETVEILHRLFECEKNIYIWSGRCESVRDKTEEWLLNNIEMKYCTRFDPSKNLKMRPIRDNTPDDQLKEKWLDETLAEDKKIDFVFDDRPKVIRMWRRREIFVFNCCQNNEEF
jgi:hydroxymethylpyrimidine pyrophosphatase-like HAD family hydrolase